MSQDRDVDVDQCGTGPPMCSLEHAEKARKHYCGVVRPPQLPDEEGAVNVVEVVFGAGERIGFFRIADSQLCEVRRLPSLHAAGAQSVAAPAPRQVVALHRRKWAPAQARLGPLFGGK